MWSVYDVTDSDISIPSTHPVILSVLELHPTINVRRVDKTVRIYDSNLSFARTGEANWRI